MMNALMARPGRVAAGLAIATVLCVVVILMRLQVDGDVARAIKGRSEVSMAHALLEARFAAPSKDEILLVRTDDFATDAALRALEDLVIDLQLTPGVRGVFSLFALPDPEGGGVSFLARNDIAALPAAERLDRLDRAAPIAPYLLSKDRSAALLMVLPDPELPDGEVLDNLTETIGLADPALSVSPVSLAALQREISAALIADQLFLAPGSTLLCVMIALLLFRSWRAAVLCAVPSVIGLGWTFAAMAALGFPMDPFMAIMPTLIIVLGIADSVHVFHAVLRHAETMDLKQATARGLAETMPAVMLASLTTMLAFASLLYVGSPTVANLAIVGPIGLALTTLAVWLALPPAILLLYRSHPPGRSRPLQFARITGAALWLLDRRGRVVAVALVLLALLFAAQTRTVAGSRLMDHVPRAGGFAETLAALQDVLPGSDQNFVILDAADPAEGVQPADRALLTRAAKALYGTGAGVVPDRDVAGIDLSLLTRFQGTDGTRFALPLIGRLDVDWTATLAAADAAATALTAAGVQDFTITGYSLMSATELPLVVSELRLAFYIAVGLVTVLAGVLMRSARLAAISLIPNLIPVLGVEAWLALSGKPLTITGAIAFTIAFGIAVDDTIHLMNRVRVARRPGAPIDRAVIEDALRTTAAPVITTTLILLAGFALTAFSMLPSVALFGQLTAAAMLLAVIADLFLFPGLLCWAAKGARDR